MGTGKEQSVARKWISTLVIVLMGVASGGAVVKPAPVMSTLVASGVMADMAQGGLLLSIPLIVATVVALPAGMFMDRFGAKKVAVVALALGLVGAVVGSMASSYEMLAATRVFEGACNGIVTGAGMALISQLFEPEKRGAPMALWSCFSGLGSIIFLNTASVVVDQANPSTWSNIWMFSAALFAAALVLMILIVRVPAAQTAAEVSTEKEAKSTSILAGLAAIAPWAISFAVFAAGFTINTVLSFEPTYLLTDLGIDFAASNAYASLFSGAMLVSGLLMTAVLSLVKTLRGRSLLLVCVAVITAFLVSVAFCCPAGLVAPCMVVGGFIGQSMLAMCMTLAPEAAKGPEHLGATMGLFTLFMNLAGAISSLAAGAIIDSSGFGGVVFLQAGVGIVGIVATVILLMALARKKQPAEAA